MEVSSHRWAGVCDMKSLEFDLHLRRVMPAFESRSQSSLRRLSAFSTESVPATKLST